MGWSTKDKNEIKKEQLLDPRPDLTPDSRRSREWHFKNAAVWLSPSRKLILGLPCFWSEIFTFFRLFCLDLCIFLIIFNFFWKIHHFVCIFLYKMHIWYTVLIFYKKFIFSIKKWLLYLKLYVFGRFFSKKATWSQKSLNLMKLLKTLVKVHKNDFFFLFLDIFNHHYLGIYSSKYFLSTFFGISIKFYTYIQNIKLSFFFIFDRIF